MPALTLYLARLVRNERRHVSTTRNESTWNAIEASRNLRASSHTLFEHFPVTDKVYALYLTTEQRCKSHQLKDFARTRRQVPGDEYCRYYAAEKHCNVPFTTGWQSSFGRPPQSSMHTSRHSHRFTSFWLTRYAMYFVTQSVQAHSQAALPSRDTAKTQKLTRNDKCLETRTQ